MIMSMLFGVLVGAVMGLTGAGGGILAVPVLVMGLGWSMQEAAPVALIAVTGAAGLGAYQGLQHKITRYRAATLMALVGIPCSVLGVALAQQLSQRWLMAGFAMILLWVAARLIWQTRDPGDKRENALCHLHGDTGRFVWNRATLMLMSAIGAVAGFMAGLMGVGGGFVIVPLLRRYTSVSLQGIVATSLLVTALVGAASVISAVMHGAQMPLLTTLGFVAAVMLGMVGGRIGAKHLSERQIQISFAALLLFVMCSLLVKAYSLP